MSDIWIIRQGTQATVFDHEPEHGALKGLAKKYSPSGPNYKGACLEACEIAIEVDRRLSIAIKALEQIRQDTYELNPFTVGESAMAKVAREALIQVGVEPK